MAFIIIMMHPVTMIIQRDPLLVKELAVTLVKNKCIPALVWRTSIFINVELQYKSRRYYERRSGYGTKYSSLV